MSMRGYFSLLCYFITLSEYTLFNRGAPNLHLHNQVSPLLSNDTQKIPTQTIKRWNLEFRDVNTELPETYRDHKSTQAVVCRFWQMARATFRDIGPNIHAYIVPEIELFIDSINTCWSLASDDEFVAKKRASAFLRNWITRISGAIYPNYIHYIIMSNLISL